MSDKMNYALRKLTLLDYPGKVACTLFTYGCNFRCPFCHNATLVTLPPEKEDFFSFEEIRDFLSRRQGILDGVCITGGEPMLDHALPELLSMIRSLGYSIKLDTNGSFPEKLKETVTAKLVDAVAMDIKNTSEKYDVTTGVPGMAEKCMESMEYLKTAPLEYCEFRTTVTRTFHTKDDLLTIAAMLKGARHYFLQKFVDSGHLIGTGLEEMSDEEMRALLPEMQAILPVTELRGV